MPRRMDLEYWRRALAALAGRLQDREFRRDWLSAGLEVRPRAPFRSLFERFPELEHRAIDVGRVTYRRSNMDPLEQYCISAVVEMTRPDRIFEIGTFDGATTHVLARSAPEAEVLTLDLPPESAVLASVAQEATHAGAGEVGSRFRDTPEASRITQLLGDSTTFDYTPWEGAVDLVLVDAGHEYENARADSQAALRLLRPGGVILWDDYEPGWPGVVRAVDELQLPVVRLTPGLAAYFDPSPGQPRG